MARQIVDLFAGAGGWEEGLRGLGRSALGIEIDPTACACAEAAGHERLRADVTALRPEDFAPVWGLVASPPCQSFSVVGKRAGRLDKPQVTSCARELAAGRDTRTRRLGRCRDARSLLTVEPLRWALRLRPRWLAFEQVPAVSELWSLFAELLAGEGYRSTVATLSAERYGVPQVRKRAFLIASLDGEPRLPAPTHRSYCPRRHSVPEPERELPEPIGMARALDWEEPAALAGGRLRSLEHPSHAVVGSSHGSRIEPSSPRAPRPCGAKRRGEPRQADWPHRRPATTVLADPRITAPGSWPRCGRRAELVRSRPVRVSPEQAAVLQGFRHDYPFQGSRGERFAAIGNAVPPPLAEAVLREAMAPTLRAGVARRRRRGARREG